MSRVGASLLHAVELDELAAASWQQYIEIAEALARDRDRLRELRATLRPRMGKSALMDGAGLARAIESAFREMFITWCKS